MTLVTAIWSAGFAAHYAPEDRILQPGDRAKVPEHEATNSSLWTIPTPAPAKNAKSED